MAYYYNVNKVSLVLQCVNIESLNNTFFVTLHNCICSVLIFVVSMFLSVENNVNSIIKFYYEDMF